MIYAPVINSSYYSDIAGFLLTLFKRSNIVISDGNTINNYRQFLESKIYLQKKNKDKNAGFSYSDLCSFLHKNDNKNSDPSSAPAKNEHYQSDGQKHSQPGRTSSPVQSGSGIFGTYTDSAGSAKISKTVKASSISRRKKSIPQRELPFLEDEFHTMHQITGFPFSIGRDPSCDLVINDMNISSTHAVISDINGEYYISDNDSTNGTYINGGEISHEPLADGCEFSLYETKFVFHYAQSAPEKSEHEKSGTRQPLTKTHAVSGKKKPSEYTAYIQDVSNSQNYYISVYPWSSEKLPGVEITGSEKSLALRNISCDILSAESEKIEKGVSFPLFSGCSFSIGSSKYIFYMKY